MAQWLKQSTAATLKMGPFVDATDGATAETGLTIAQANIRIAKAGGDFAQTNNATGGTHDENGYYDIPLDTTDTNTLGRLRVAISMSGALPVWQDFVIVAANIFDSLIGGGDVLDVSAIQILGTAVSAPATAGILDVNVKNINNVAAATAGAAGGVAIVGSQVDLVNAPNATAVTAIQSGLSTLNAAGVRTAVGLASANLDTQLAALPTAAENAAELLTEAESTPVHADVKQINSTNVTGNGSVGTPWGPA